MRRSIDINCDMGESYGHFQVGNDEALMPFISSSNLACGFHGGDPFTMLTSLKLAKTHKVSIGAHPSYLNIRGFGRESTEIPLDKLEADLIYQISALSGMAQGLGLRVSYVKAHGFLYHQVNQKEAVANCLLKAIQQLDPGLAIMGLPGSVLEQMTQKNGLNYIREGFLDRKYQSDGNLVSRKEPGAVLENPSEVLEQLEQIVLHDRVQTADGEMISMQVDSLCIHGDHPNSIHIARQVFLRLEQLSIPLEAFGS